MSEIIFSAAVYKVQTLIDGGVRVTLDLPEDAIPQMAMLAEARREGIPLSFTAKVHVETHLDGKEIDNGSARRGRKAKTG